MTGRHPVRTAASGVSAPLLGCPPGQQWQLWSGRERAVRSDGGRAPSYIVRQEGAGAEPSAWCAWTSGFGHPCVRFWIFSCDPRRLPFWHLCTTFAVSQPPRECQELAPGWPDLPVGPGEPAEAQLSQGGGLCRLRCWEKPHCGGYGTWFSGHPARTALHTGPELRPLVRARSEPLGLSMASDTCSLGVKRVSVPPRSLRASAQQSQ